MWREELSNRIMSGCTIGVILLTPIVDSPEYSTDGKCNYCQMFNNCKERVGISMWVACEIPTLSDIVSIRALGSDAIDKYNDFYRLLINDRIKNIFTEVFFNSSPVSISNSD